MIDCPRQAETVSAIRLRDEICFISQLGHHQQPHPAERPQPGNLLINGQRNVARSEAPNALITNIDQQVQPIVATPNPDSKIGRQPVSVLNGIDARLTQRRFDIINPSVIKANLSSKRSNGLPCNDFISELTW